MYHIVSCTSDNRLKQSKYYATNLIISYRVHHCRCYFQGWHMNTL